MITLGVEVESIAVGEFVRSVQVHPSLPTCISSRSREMGVDDTRSIAVTFLAGPHSVVAVHVEVEQEGRLFSGVSTNASSLSLKTVSVMSVGLRSR